MVQEYITNLQKNPSNEGNVITEQCEQFLKIVRLDLINDELENFFLQNFDFTKHFYVISFYQLFSERFKNLIFDKNNIESFSDENFPLPSVSLAIQFYIKRHHDGVEYDSKIEKIFKEYANKLLSYILKSSIFDKPLSTVDFKRCILRAYGKIESTYDIDSDFEFDYVRNKIKMMSRAKFFKIIAIYIEKFDHNIGLELYNKPITNHILTKNVSWNDEMIFIDAVEEKMKNLDDTSTEFIDKVGKILINNIRILISDKIQGQRFDATDKDVFEELKKVFKDFQNSDLKRFGEYSERYFNVLAYYVFKMCKVNDFSEYSALLDASNLSTAET